MWPQLLKEDPVGFFHLLSCKLFVHHTAWSTPHCMSQIKHKTCGLHHCQTYGRKNVYIVQQIHLPRDGNFITPLSGLILHTGSEISSLESVRMHCMHTVQTHLSHLDVKCKKKKKSTSRLKHRLQVDFTFK